VTECSQIASLKCY